MRIQPIAIEKEPVVGRETLLEKEPVHLFVTSPRKGTNGMDIFNTLYSRYLVDQKYFSSKTRLVNPGGQRILFIILKEVFKQLSA